MEKKEQSPCLKCPFHEMGLSKKFCSRKCAEMKAFTMRELGEWKGGKEPGDVHVGTKAKSFKQLPPAFS